MVSLMFFTCSPSDGFDGAPAEDCSGVGLPETVDGLPTREISIGYGIGDDKFEAWTDGGTVKIQSGFQGADMLTPDLRVASDPGDADESCWRVMIGHYDENGDPLTEYEGEVIQFSDALVFDKDGENHYSGPAFDQLYAGTDGDTIEVRATVIGEDFAGEHAVTVTLKR